MTMGKLKSVENAAPATTPTRSMHLPAQPLSAQPSSVVSPPGGFPSAIGNQAMQRLVARMGIQAKLTISQHGDPDEQEADHVADQVMRMAEPGPIHSAAGVIHRKCATCETGDTPCAKCDEEEKVRRKESPGHGSPISPTVHAQIAGLRGGGHPLPPSMRAFFEPRFDADFSLVRVHTNSAAAEAAGAIQAKAFTSGQDVAFAAGEYVPDSATGRKLLAHELTHTLQQQNGAAAPASGPMSRRSDAAKRKADGMADTREEARPSGRPAAIHRQASSAIQRDEAKAGFGNQPHAVGQAGFGNQPPPVRQAGFGNEPHAVREAGFGNHPHAVKDDPAFGADPSQVASADIRSEPADLIEPFKRVWMTGGRAALDSSVYELLSRMSTDRGADSVDRFADRFWDYVWLQVGGRITNDPTVQMMVGFGATVLSQLKRLKEDVEAKATFITFFEEQARQYTRHALNESEERVRGELKHYGLTFPDDSSSLVTWVVESIAAKRALGVAAAGLARRRNALIKANAPYRDMVRHTSYSKPIEDTVARATREYEIFRLQMIPLFPILGEFSSPEIDAFNNEDEEPDDTQGEKLNTLAQMAHGGGGKDATDVIVDVVFEKLRNIDKVRKGLKPGGEVNIWRVPEIVAATREVTGAGNGTVEGHLVEQKFEQENRPPNESETLLGKILLYGGLLLAPFTDFLSIAPYVIYKLGKVDQHIAEHMKNYMMQEALHGTDFGALALSAEDPSLFWLAGDILDAGMAIMDVALLAAPAARIFRELVPLARLARELQAGEEALSVLKNTAEELAIRELGAGTEKAAEFAEKVAEDAHMAKTGDVAGMTADEARMLEHEEAKAAAAAREARYRAALEKLDQLGAADAKTLRLLDPDSVIRLARLEPEAARRVLRLSPEAVTKIATLSPDRLRRIAQLDPVTIEKFAQLDAHALNYVAEMNPPTLEWLAKLKPDVVAKIADAKVTSPFSLRQLAEKIGPGSSTRTVEKALARAERHRAQLERAFQAAKKGDWGRIPGAERTSIGKHIGYELEELARAAASGGRAKNVLNYRLVDSKLIAKLEQDGGRAVITQGQLKGGDLRFDLVEIDFDAKTVELIDLVPEADAAHIRGTKLYEEELRKLLPEDFTFMSFEQRYVNAQGQVGESLEEALVQ